MLYLCRGTVKDPKASDPWKNDKGFSLGRSVDIYSMYRKFLSKLSTKRCLQPEGGFPIEIAFTEIRKTCLLVHLWVITPTPCPTIYNKHTELLRCCGYSIREPASPPILVFLCVYVSIFSSFYHTQSGQIPRAMQRTASKENSQFFNNHNLVSLSPGTFFFFLLPRLWNSHIFLHLWHTIINN